jgi:glutamate-1-semialdehyde 2,1-aminomutase
MTREESLAEIRAKIESEYERRTSGCLAVMQRARRVMPGGDTRRSVFFFPYPIWIRSADGCHITDEDGNDYIDFHNCYTVMILGHGNPGVKAAVREQLDQGTMALGAFKEIVVRWAEILCQRVDSVEQVRFTNTGTEAVMMAIRAARAFTGKDRIIMEEAGYHGAYDTVVYPPGSPGLSTSIRNDTILVPYNDRAAMEKAVADNKDRAALVILEGLMGSAGMIPPRDGYLKSVRDITAANGIVFILDEVMSFRLDYGGLQRVEGIKPDLTAFGKIMAGGTAGAALGGRRDIMQQFSPETQKLHHAGTLNANPLAAAAGVAQMEQVTPQLIDRINKLGESLAAGIRNVFQKANIKGQVTGIGSLQNIHFSPVPVVDGRTSRESNNPDLMHLFHLSLLNRGIFTPDRGLFCISSPMTDKEIAAAVQAVDDTVTELKPHIERIWPELIGSVVL